MALGVKDKIQVQNSSWHFLPSLISKEHDFITLIAYLALKAAV